MGNIDVWHPWEEDRELPGGGMMKEEAEREPIAKRRQEKE